MFLWETISAYCSTFSSHCAFQSAFFSSCAQLASVINVVVTFFCRIMNETNSSSSSNSTDEGIDCYTDDFCWMMEGLGILIIGWIGVFGNSFSMVLFSKQKVHRIFHHLLLLLSVFDLVRIFFFFKLKMDSFFKI